MLPDPRMLQQPPGPPGMAPPGMPGMAPQPPIAPGDIGRLVMSQLGPPGQPPPGQMLAGPNDFGDPVLSQLEMTAPTQWSFDPELGLPDRLKAGYMPPMDAGVWREVADADEMQFRGLLDRFSRDVALWRGRNSAKPPGFDPKRELAFKSATFSNIVNKLTNMAAPLDHRYVVPFKDDLTRQFSQIMENWHEYNRKCEVFEYAASGGHSSLQQDEFLYLFLYGRVCARVLPRPERAHHPFQVTLLDPATVFPVWGGDSEGLVRVTHKRPMTAIDVISTYLPYSPNLTERVKDSVASKFGFQSAEYQRYFYVERDLIEVWNTWRKYVFWGDVEVQSVEHKLGYCPFVYVMARGEPRGMTTPQGKQWYNLTWDQDIDDPDYPDVFRASDRRADEAEKGVSVFHHLVRTNRMTEVVYSLLMTQILQASRPATINYVAQTGWGKLPKPLDTKPGGTNYRRMNVDDVQQIPTSPRPTDASPVINKLQSETVEGSINPAMYGATEGSNIAGYAVESMIAAAKDSVLPYMEAWQLFQALKCEMQARQYRDQIIPVGIMSVPMEGKYGSSPTADVTAEVIRGAGTKVEVELIGLSDQQLPAMVNTAGMAIERGLWSRRKGMEKLGEKDPDRMIRDIIVERALEHPQMMEDFLIPVTFIKNGQKSMADLWVLLVVMPKVQMMMAQMMGPMAQGMMGAVQQTGAAIPPGGGPPNPMAMLGAGGPQANGQSNPNALRARGRPTGPASGQGRGPAPQSQLSPAG